MTPKEAAKLELKIEGLIDAHGVGTILNAIANVCHDKAQHIRENWQDDPLARQWDKNAQKVAQIILL